MHKVICPICHETFDADKIPYILKGRRYIHQTCQEKEDSEEIERKKLEEYIKNLTGMPLSALIKKQLKDYKKEYNYSYSGMLKTLKYWKEVKKMSLESKSGIGIIPYIYDEAKTYYYNLFLIKERNKDKDIKSYNVEKQVKISAPHRPKKKINLWRILSEE